MLNFNVFCRKFSRLLLSFFFLNFPIIALSNITNAQSQQIQNEILRWQKRLNIPAVSLSISVPGNDVPINFVSGTTTLNGSQAITSNTLFQAGSISKSFTSMIILQLAAQGKLSLDDPITKYLPQYPRWNNVTIRQLLNHTSGIFDYTKAAKFNQIRKNTPQAEFSPEMIVSMASGYRQLFTPGKGWKYSNTNYVLAGMIIEVVTKMPISQVINFYLRQVPRLHLPNTFYLPRLYSQAEISHMAHGYNSDGVDTTQNSMSWAFTAGALVSTPTDLLTWWQALFQKRIFNNEQLAQMMSLVCEYTSKKTGCIAGQPVPFLREQQVDKRYGLGIIQSASGSSEIGTIWWHNGSTQGYKAIVMWLPKSDIYIALMIDRDPGYLLTPNLPIIRKILHILLSGSIVDSDLENHTPIKSAKKTATKSKHHIKQRQHKINKNQK